MIDVDVIRKQGKFSVRATFAGPQTGATALFGPSGAGKSSIINMVAGLMRPDAGRIHINGRPLFDSAGGIDLPPEKRRVGYVFQDGRLLPHLSVRANLTYGMALTPVKERFIRPEQVVDLLGIGHLLQRRPAGLSGGEKQRVAIGRALLTSPTLLLMDEPLASLDQARKHEILPFIRRLGLEFSLPVFYVSHSLEEVIQLAPYLVILDNGRVKAAGDMAELMSRPELGPLLHRTDVGAILDTIVALPQDNNGLTHLEFAGGILKVPHLNAARGDAIHVQIPAKNVGIALQQPVLSSFQNIFNGVIETIGNNDGPFVTLRLDIGCLLLAQVTLSARDCLDLQPGQRVYALVTDLDVSHGRYD